ncbi:unnamed protein product [Rotaria sp. Silwood1]|nr:unnamed protein product [Rotaria sp. Silwood1]CAF3466283.1 unnamed protein product [Rotaria sp. Silwood1]CAF3524312.1 unnamed protein product [Rotaria sp. Silwood1]CAF4674673.1 unnamed protein product [Rotaria sp. Silwood1]
MATSTRQFGRRGANYVTTATANNTNIGGIVSTSSTGSIGAPPRRYVLDVPTSRTSRTARTTYRMNDDYDETNTGNRSAGGSTRYSTVFTTNINNENDERLSRSGSREYYYRDESSDPSATTVTRYLEDASMKHLLESGTSYANTVVEDQEVQALTAKATPDVKNYPINVDSNPELIVRPNTQRLTYKQDIAVRYLRPNTPPPPGPIVIREIRAPPPPHAPPIILRQRPPPPRTPSPIIIREKPPSRPKSVPTTVIKKVIPPPPPPPRKLIIERLPNLPPKPRPVIIERWLPYHKQKRQVIHEKAKPLEPMTRIKNTIIEWRPPEVEVVKYVKKLGIQDADPQRYYSQHGDKLYTTEFVQQKLTELGLQEELTLMQQQQTSAVNEEVALEKADEYNVRQILNSYEPSSSSRHTYTTNTGGSGVRLVRSYSHSGITDDYGEQQILYDRSPNNSATVIYNANNYNFDQNSSTSPVLTEEMLLRSHASNNGKFPTHLLTKLGSQIYDMPSDQVDLSNNARQTTATTTRYYTVNQGETGYESTGDTGSGYTEEKYVQITSSDLKNMLPNYELYSSTGQKLEGEQLNF